MKYILLILSFFFLGCNSDPLKIEFPKEVMTEFHCLIPKKHVKVVESKEKRELTITNETDKSIEILCSHIILVPEYNKTPQIHRWEEQILPRNSIKINLISNTTFYYYYTIVNKNKEETLFLGLYSYYKKN